MTHTDEIATADEAAFAQRVERHRRELHVHCYRMLGSFEESEDLVQETFLRAWRARNTFEGRASVRAWLYRIATNACLDALDKRPRVATGREVAWLQPSPTPCSRSSPLHPASRSTRSSTRRRSSWRSWSPSSTFRPGRARR